MANSGLIVRRSVRFEISLPARIRVAPHHVEALNFAKGVCGDDRWIDVSVIDFAAGGLGFITEIFLPRNVDLEVEVPGFANNCDSVLLRCILQVKRVQMTDRRPAYQIGCSFINVDDDTTTQIESMLERLSGMSEEDGGDLSDA